MSVETLPCLRIAVTVPVKGTFSYLVPEQLIPEARVGCRVLVPFGNRTVTGYILEKISQEQAGIQGDQTLKEVARVLDPEPFFHHREVPFFEWMAGYYLHPIGQTIQSALPGGLNKGPFKTGYLTDKGLSVLKSLSHGSEEEALLSWIRDHSGKRLPHSHRKVYELQRKGWIVTQEGPEKRRTGPLMRKFVRPTKGQDLKGILAENRNTLKAKQELEFLETIFGSRAVLVRELKAQFTNASYLINKWSRKGVLESYRGEVFRNPAGSIMFPSPIPLQLHTQQRHALNYVERSLNKRGFSSCLLYGVTGSGKTEVYYRGAEHAIRLGRQVIVMVPEIALAVYMEGIFRSRLGNRIAIYHSGLSQGERYDQWMRMVRGQVDLVIGARSALFAPMPRLGLIIVDEEHDSAYKQESNPRYQGRDAAVMRAKVEDALVILGSGTPSVQSFQNCMSGRYHLLSMPERVEKRPLPDVEIVDMKALEETRSKNDIISPKLQEALEKELKEGNQCILFLNRRGFHRLYLCRTCGHSIHCPNCDVALTYHLREKRLSCHYCGFFSEIPSVCPSCGRGGLRPYGFGTEKLEQGLSALFPEARISRLDTDSVRRKGQAFQILKMFIERQVDILVGTQMITKGYDFPGVTLVGVISADLSLSFPDFRAGERTFQVLSQVAGRAGRGSRKGRVIIQTFSPDHYAITTATAHDYQSFFNREKELRWELGYPPFSHLACLRLHGNNKGETAEVVDRLGQGIRAVLSTWRKRGKDIQVLGPAEAPISRLKGKYRWHILVKSRNVSLLQHLLDEVERISRKVLSGSGVQLILDVDPYQMI